MRLFRPTLDASIGPSGLRLETARTPFRRTSVRWIDFPARAAGARVPAGFSGALGQALAAWPRAQVRVSLDDHWVRYALLTDVDHALRSAELVRLGDLVLRRTYGDAMDECVTRISPAGSFSLLAAAIERAVLDALQVAIASTGGRLVSLVPAFAASVNQRRRRPLADEWLVALERDSVAVALFERGVLRRLRVRRARITNAADLARFLDAEAARAGTGNRRVCVSGETDGFDALALSGWTVRGDSAARSGAQKTRAPDDAEHPAHGAA